jgi:hypothetical protein
MSEMRKLAASLAAVLTVGILSGVSLFADSRPSKETERSARERVSARGSARGERGARATESRRGDERRGSGEQITVRGERAPRETAVRGDRSDRPRRDRDVAVDSPRESRGETRGTVRGERTPERRDRTADRNDRRGGTRDGYRNNDRRGGTRESYRHGDRRSSTPYYASGRVSRTERHGHGYRVWVHGHRYPFFIPLSHWHHNRFRVGLLINIGGYYNPYGYYDYYDGPRSVAGYIRGTVEDINYRRGSLVLRNESTGSFVTVYVRSRYLDEIREGDYVEVSGDWRRSGIFDADRIDYLDDGYYRR